MKMETTAGDFIIEVHREWAPLGADRFYNLVGIGYFNDVAFFRVLAGFMAQAGFHGNPAVSQGLAQRSNQGRSGQPSPILRAWSHLPRVVPTRGALRFFINYGDNSYLDASGFAPFGKVVEGFESVKELYSGYGEGEPNGKGPAQGKLYRLGNDYLKAEFPELDYITRAVDHRVTSIPDPRSR